MEEKVAAIIAALRERYPDALCALHYGKDYELMISVRLSAQCTDARVNQSRPRCLRAIRRSTPLRRRMWRRSEEYVRSCGFFRHKAQDIVAACRMLRDEYGGRVPDTMEQLCAARVGGRRPTCCWATSTASRPSCATRTASASQTASGWPAARSRRRSSGQLRAILPPEESSDFCHRIVLFGREVCTARSPHCDRCELRPYCREFSGE